MGWGGLGRKVSIEGWEKVDGGGGGEVSSGHGGGEEEGEKGRGDETV